MRNFLFALSLLMVCVPSVVAAQPTEDRLKQFVIAYFDTWSNSGTDVSTLSRFYAMNINFYNGAKSASYVMDQKAKFAVRWPSRRYTVSPNFSITCSDMCSISGVVHWETTSAARGDHSSGDASYFFKIFLTDTASYGGLIVSENGSVITSHKESLPPVTSAAAASPEPSAPPAARNQLFRQLFDPEMIDSQLPYFESLAGPAWKVTGNTRLYKIDDCQISVGVENNAVQYMKTSVSPKCTINAQAFQKFSISLTPKLTFGEYERAFGGGGRFESTCIDMCGNSADPLVYEFFDGYHANDFMEVRLGVVLVDSPSIDAADQVANAYKHLTGKDDAVYAVCDNRFDGWARKSFANIQVTSVQFGHHLPALDTYCTQ